MVRPDILADLPRVRAAPMGWWFPMVFVIHGAAPGGVLFGLSLGGVIPTPWAYGGVVFGFLLALVGGGALVLYGLSIKGRIDAMRKAAAGVPLHATVIGLDKRLGNFRSRNPSGSFRASKYALTLDVWHPNGQRYQTSQQSYFNAAELPALQPGARLQVHVDLSDPQTVFVPFCQPAQPRHPPLPPGQPFGFSM